jgi:hypothetical protein
MHVTNAKNMEHIILEHYFEQELTTTATAASCTEILKLKLKPAICKKPRGLSSKGILLLNNNMHLHSATVATEAIRQLKFGLLPHSHIV